MRIPSRRLTGIVRRDGEGRLALPWLLDGLGIDPAHGSGPLATVIQDSLSVVI